MKTKTYVLPVSRTFPKTHKRAGESMYFIEKINNSIGDTESCNVVVHTFNENVSIWPKIHTIRANYPLWEKRIKEVQEGKAILSLRYWSGKPYHSIQVEFAQLGKDSGIGIQKLKSFDVQLGMLWVVNNNRNVVPEYIEQVAKNDGLSLDDFMGWFKKFDLSKPMAIIHFTGFRY